jgi:hypothetical protein
VNQTTEELMAPVNNATFVHATERVRALRKAGTSENSLAKTIGVSRTAVRTILNRGAHHTRGSTKKRVLKWAGAGARGPASTPKAGRPPAKTPAATPAPAPAKKAVRRRRRRRRSTASATPVAPQQAAPREVSMSFAHVELPDGRTVRLAVGERYMLHNGRLLRAL